MPGLRIAACLAAFPVLLAGADLRFEAPSLDSPRYAIRLTFEVQTVPVTIKEVRLDGTVFDSPLLFRSGAGVDRSAALEPGTYDIVLDYAWAAKKRYQTAVVYQEKDSAKTGRAEYSGVSPAAGAIPEGAEEGFHRVYAIHEEAGLAREGEICCLTLTGPQARVGESSFRLFDGSRELPCQVLERRESAPGEKAPANPPCVTCKLAFPVDMAPKQTKLILAVKGRPQKPPGGTLVLTGEGLGRTLQTDRLTVQFHPQSGQILTVECAKEKVKLWNKEGVIHRNPDVCVPGVAWDHSSDWNPPQVFEERTGGLLYVNARRGPLPRVRDVDLEVRYTFEPGKPCFVAETRLTAEKDLGVAALRNDEMVFFKDLFDTLMYRDLDGSIVTLPLREKAEAPSGLAHIAAPDVPWVGLLNMKEGYGFFSVRLDADQTNLAAAGNFLHRAGTYFYAPAEGSCVSWVRPLLYTRGEYATNNLTTFLPKGSTFYEKNAYILLRLGGQTPRELDTLLRTLRNPLRVY